MGQNPTDPEEAHTPISKLIHTSYTHGAPPSVDPSHIAHSQNLKHSVLLSSNQKFQKSTNQACHRANSAPRPLPENTHVTITRPMFYSVHKHARAQVTYLFLMHFEEPCPSILLTVTVYKTKYVIHGNRLFRVLAAKEQLS